MPSENVMGSSADRRKYERNEIIWTPSMIYTDSKMPPLVYISQSSLSKKLAPLSYRILVRKPSYHRWNTPRGIGVSGLQRAQGADDDCGRAG
jgi:hypothetical protein